MTVGEKVPVLLAAAGESWESMALGQLPREQIVVLKRCVDLPDLLASAASGQARVAVVSGHLPGLDGDAVVRLLRHDVRCVAVGGDGEALARLGVVGIVEDPEPDALADAVRSAGDHELVIDPESTEPSALSSGGRRGRVLAVHGPAGAPGRTTVAIGIATEHARAGESTVLVDADPYGGAVAQHLGVLDEVSGLLASARLVNAGTLDHASFSRCRRVVADRLEVLTGLPRPDRWVEARPGVLDAVVAQATEVGDVVLDTGFSLEDAAERGADPGRGLARNQLTLDAVAIAEVIVVVGTAEPTGLARLARSLVELRDSTSAPLVVVVNRMRDSLGWRERDIVGMIEGYVRPESVHFLPEDRATTDRALVTGRSVGELGDSGLRRGLAELHAATLGAAEILR